MLPLLDALEQIPLPAVITFWLSGTGAPPVVVSGFLSDMTGSRRRGPE
ncbi:MAG: hypothetical protein Q8P18_10925 [Pseudomonadota bacterium]|nr:hypothetical protein [Pseudomonadota bacterium]